MNTPNTGGSSMTTALLPPHPDNPHPLGRHVQHDERSRNFAFTAPTPYDPNRSVLWPTCATILNQRNLGACVGFTGADLLNTGYMAKVRSKMHARRLYRDKDGINFYHLATENDSIPGTYPPSDSGSTGLGLAKALKQLGLINSYSHAFGFDQFRAALAFGPVAVGTLWTESMFHPDKDGLVHVGDLTDTNIAGGHEYMARGVNPQTKRIRCRNHWTAAWGDHGEFDITFDDFITLLAHQGDVTIMHPAVT